MADEQIVTSIVAKADLSSLVSEVHRVTASLQQLQRELIASNKSIAASTKVANNAFRDTLVQSGLFSSHFVNLNSDVNKFGKNLDTGRLKLRDYFSTFQTHLKTSKGLIRELAKEQVMLENAILQPLGRNAQGLMQYNVHVPRGLDAIKNKSQLARMELQIFNKALLEGSTSLINWGKNTQWAGRQLTVGLTVPLTMFGAAAAKAFKEADQELTRLVKVYGDIAGTSAEELGRIRKDVTATAKELSSAMGVSFKETLALAADVAATGKTGQDLIASVKETTRLAVLGEVDRQEAMKATLAIQTAFKSNTEELTESINFLNAVENQTSTTLNDLVEAIPKAGTVVKQLGGSVEDLALYITAMREGGVNASEAANALKSGLASMINPTKQTIGVMSDFGIDIMGMVARNTGNTTGMILDLQAALETLDPLSKARALEQMFGKFQFARMAALFNNLNKSGSQTVQVMELMNATAGELASVAGRELSLVTESASGKFKRAVESLKASMSGIGEQFLEFGTKVLNVFEKIVNFFNNLPGPVQKLLALFGGVTAIAGPLIMITGVLANFFGYITKGIVLMRSFFQGTKGWKMLTPEMIAAEKAARMVEKSFYSDAAAANVLHTALQKLIFDYASLKTSMAAGVIPVNPTVSTVGGSTIIPGVPGMRREVDPTSAYAGELETRAMSHINPRDPNNPASLMGVVPGAIPVNRGIGRTPQIYMSERLPDIEGLTSVKGISTGIVSGEAARFHALMATLGMQTQEEVAALKKTVALGGTVSKELLDTFDDILPITAKIADGAAVQSAAIVGELRAGTITIEQARAKIIALNAQIDAMLREQVGLYAASKGRTIDFTKAPLMDQPVVDASGQFTLRDLFKKESNKGVLEEIGRLRGIRTFGAPYSIETTRLPKFATGGDIEGFGPNKTVVSGPTSINYDDRIASLPVDGYVLNQSASMNPNNQWIRNIAPSTYTSSGPTIEAAVTPGEIVLGPGIHRDPLLYAAVDAANNGYNLGGGIINTIRRGYGRSIGSSDLRDLYSKIFRVEARVLSSPNWEQEVRLRSIMHDASILHSHAGLTEDEAIAQATKYFDDAWDATYDSKTGLIDPRQWMAARIKGAKGINAKLNALIENGRDDLRNLESYGGVGQTARFRPTSNLLGKFREQASSGKFGGVSLFDRVIGSLYPRGFDIEQFKGDEFLPVSEHTIREGLWTDPKTGKQFSMAGNFGMAMLGEREINSLTADIHRATGAARPDQIPLTNAAKRSDIRQQQRRNVDFTSPRMTSGTRQWLLRAIMGRLDPRSYFMPNASRFAYSGYNAGGPIGYRKGGGVVRRNRAAYGNRLRTRYDAMSGKHILTELPDNFPYQIPLGTPLDNAELGYLQRLPKTNYVDNPNSGSMRPRGSGMMMAGSMAIGMGSYSAGLALSGGNQMVGMAAGIAGDMASFKIMDALFNKSKDAAKGGSMAMKAFQWLWKLPGPVKLVAALVTVGLAVKKVFDAINNHRKTVSLAFGPSADIVEKLNLKFTTLNDTLNATKARMEAFKESGGALYATYTSAGIPGITLSIKQLSELKQKVTQDFPELIQMFDQAAGSEVSAKAASLKAQFVAGGMDAQEATNIIYALIAASNKATFAIRAIASQGFRSIKDEATAASASIQTFYDLINEGNIDQLVSAFDTVLNALQASETKLIGLTMNQYEVVDAAEAYQLTLERINSTQGSNNQLSGGQLEALKAQNPVLATILGTSETLASVFAKLRMYSMGISMDFTQLDPQMAQKLSVAIMKMDTFYRTDKTKSNPFAGLVSQIEKAREASEAADQKTIENAEKKKEDLEELIELKQKEIEAIREEADARRRALEEEQQDEDILLQIKKKQLEYNNALAAGDMQTAAQAQLDIQRLVGQQQTEFAKRAIDEKEKRDVDAKEAEIDSLRNQIKSLQDRIEIAQDTAKKGAEDVAKLEDLLGRSIQAMMMGQGGYDKWEIGIVQGLISELKKSVNPEIKALVPVLEGAIKNPEGKTDFDILLESTLKGLKTSIDELNIILGLTKTDQKKAKEDNRSSAQKFWDGFFEKTLGFNPFNFSGGGYLRGPGTGTSDSIPGYITGYADGGAIPIRVSNTEYITRSSSVSDIGVPNMDLINQRGAEGVVMAAQNLLGVNAATGGYVNRLVNYAMGSTGGLPKTKPKEFNFNKLNDRTAYAMRHLISKGMTPEAAAGIVGNLIAESTLRPGAEEVGHTQEGRGIAQWGVNARWKTYQNWLKKNGKKGIYDLANQLDFIWWEMHNGQLANPAKFKSLTDISKAAYIFMDQYERPGVLRWKERNTHAYAAYKLYTGKDYIDAASTLYPGPDKAKQDYEKGMSSPANIIEASPDFKDIIPLKISGVSKLSALGFKNGGYLGFHKGGSAGHKHNDGNFFSRFNPVNVISQMLDGFKSFGSSQSFNKDINYKSRISQKQKDLMLLQTAQTLSGYTSAFNLKNNTSPEVFGSKNIGRALDVLGVLPAIGVTSKLALSRFNQLKKKNQEMLAVAKKEITLDDGSTIPTYGMGKHTFAFQGFKEEIPDLSSFGVTTVPTDPIGILQAALKIKPNDKKNQAMLENFMKNNIGSAERDLLDKMYAAISIGDKGEALPFENADGFINIIQALTGDAASSGYIFWKQQALIKIVEQQKAKKEAEDILGETLSARLAGVSADSSQVPTIHSTKFPAIRDADGNIVLYPYGHYNVGKTQKLDSEGNIIQPGAYPRASLHFTLEDTVKSHMMGKWDEEQAKIVSPLSSMIGSNGKPYNLNSTDTWWMRSPGEGLTIPNPAIIRPYKDATKYKEELVKRGLITADQDAPLLVVDHKTKDVLHFLKESYTDLDRSWFESLAPEYRAGSISGRESSTLETMALQEAKKLLGIETGPVSLEQHGLNSSARQDKIYKLAEQLRLSTEIHSGSYPEMLESALRKSSSAGFGTSYTHLGSPSIEALRMLMLHGITKSNAKRPQSAFDFNDGGYFNQVRKFHDWNGMVPGPYGQEVGAVLKAGTEGVYQSSYINALRNGTMNSPASNSKVINVGSVKMEFTEPVTNGRQVFEEFKSLINFENSKAGPSINIGRGA
jgi:TP901 family phage tail tape measure protein